MLRSSTSLTKLFIVLSLYILVSAQTEYYIDSEYKEKISTGSKDLPFKTFSDAVKVLTNTHCKSGSRIILLARETNYTVSSTNVAIDNCKSLEIVALNDSSSQKKPILTLNGVLSFKNTNVTTKGVDFFSTEPSEVKIKIEDSYVVFSDTSLQWLPQPQLINDTATIFFTAQSSTLNFSNTNFTTLPNTIQESPEKDSDNPAKFLNMTQSSLIMTNCTIFHDEYSSTFSVVESPVTITKSIIQTSSFSLYPLFQTKSGLTGSFNRESLTVNGLKVKLNTTGYEAHIKEIQFSKAGPFFSASDFDVILENVEIQNAASISRAPMFQQLVKFAATEENVKFRLIGLKLYDVGICYSLLSLSSLSDSNNACDVEVREITFEKVDIMETLDSWKYQEPVKEEFSLFQINIYSFSQLIFRNITLSETVWKYSANSAFFSVRSDAPSISASPSISAIFINASEIGSDLFVFENVGAIFENAQVVSSIIKKSLLRTGVNPSNDISNVKIENSILCQDTFVFEGYSQSVFIAKFNLNNVYSLSSCNEMHLPNTSEAVDLKQEFDSYVVSHSGPLENRGSFLSLRYVGATIMQSSFENIWLHGQVLISIDGTEPTTTVGIFDSSFRSFTGLDVSARLISKQKLYFEERDYQSPGHRVNFNYLALINNTFSGSWLFDKAPEIMTLNVAHLLVVDNKFMNMSVSSVRTFFSVSEFGPAPSDVKLKSWNISQGLNDSYRFVGSYFAETVMSILSYQRSYPKESGREYRIDTVVYAFVQNSFSNFTLNTPSLLLFSSPSPDFSVLLFENNTFNSCSLNDQTSSALELLLTPYKLLDPVETPPLIIRDNIISPSEDVSTLWVSFHTLEATKIELYVDSEYKGSNSTGQRDSPFRTFSEAVDELLSKRTSNGSQTGARIFLLSRKTNYTINSSNTILYNFRDLEVVGLKDSSYDSSPVIALEGSLQFRYTDALIKQVEFYNGEASVAKIDIQNSRLLFTKTSFQWYAQRLNITTATTTTFFNAQGSTLEFSNSISLLYLSTQTNLAS